MMTFCIIATIIITATIPIRRSAGSPVDVHGEDWQADSGVRRRLSHCWAGEYFGMLLMMMMMMMMMTMMTMMDHHNRHHHHLIFQSGGNAEPLPCCCSRSHHRCS